MDYIVETKELTKQFPGKLAADHVSMHIRKGDIYGFIGKNGAGKTTTMKMLLGMLIPSSGEIELFGSKDLNAQRKKIGALIEAPGIYKNCTAYENMKRLAMISGGTDADIKDILKLVGLDNTGKRKAGNFSLGMKQRLGIGLALLGNPELLILDEPINGLDPAAIKEIRDTLLKLNQERGTTILISSHLLDELAKITTRYGIINNGVLVEEVDARELEERCKQHLKISVDNTEKAIALLKNSSVFSGDDYEIKDDTIQIYSGFTNAAAVNETLVLGGIKVGELSFRTDAFEQYFIERIGK